MIGTGVPSIAYELRTYENSMMHDACSVEGKVRRII